MAGVGKKKTIFCVNKKDIKMIISTMCVTALALDLDPVRMNNNTDKTVWVKSPNVQPENFERSASGIFEHFLKIILLEYCRTLKQNITL